MERDGSGLLRLPGALGKASRPQRGLRWHRPSLSPGGPRDNAGKAEPPLPLPLPSTKGKRAEVRGSLLPGDKSSGTF